MLLNLSNHPSALWTARQTETARAEFGDVQDMPFPHISPEADQQEVQELARQHFTQIRGLRPQPQAVHIMGELTFTYALVQMLKQTNYTVVASTTHREVTLHPDGSKTSAFQFIRFRSY